MGLIAVLLLFTLSCILVHSKDVNSPLRSTLASDPEPDEKFLSEQQSKMPLNKDVILEPTHADEDYPEGTNVTDAWEDASHKLYIVLNTRLANMTRKVGDRVKMECEVAGTLPIQFVWSKGEAPLVLNKNIKINNKNPYTSILRIDQLKIFDKGFYRCQASNVVGTVKTTAVLEVHPESGDIRQAGATDFSYSLYSYNNQLSGEPTCITYQGIWALTCSHYLKGQTVYFQGNPSEDYLRALDQRLRSYLEVIAQNAEISTRCRDFAEQVACHHKFPLCDTSTNEPIKICKSDCGMLQNDICKLEYADAVKHDLIGEQKLLPRCDDLPGQDSPKQCLDILSESGDDLSRDYPQQWHWCYVGSGKGYRGTQNTSEKGNNCLRWSEVDISLYKHSLYPELIRNSYCRNPGGKRPKPWCYVRADNGSVHEEYCKLDVCAPGLFAELVKKEKGSSPNGGPDDDAEEMYFGVVHTQIAISAVFIGLFLLVIVVGHCSCYCCLRQQNLKTNSATSKVCNNNGIQKNCSNFEYNGFVNDANKPLLSGAPLMLSPGQLNNSRFLSGNNSNHNRNIFKHQPNPLFEMQSLSPSPLPELLEIPLTCISFGDKLGEGAFGVVFRGEYRVADDSVSLSVAIKTLKSDAVPRQHRDFLKEAQIMSQLQHENVVSFIGICHNGTMLCMVFEYMMHGDLKRFLLLRSPYCQGNVVDNERLMRDRVDFLYIARQISAGMEFLALHHFVHRDLAARNCLVADRLVIKISDFGLSRDVYSNDYYRLRSNERLPIRWMPAEAILYSKSSEKSDVWSFGVTLWEIYSYGKTPYEAYKDEDVITMIRNHYLLECPLNCPPSMYSLLIECWQMNPERRPTFSELSVGLASWSPSHPTAVGVQSMVYPSSSAPACSVGDSGSSCSQSGGRCHSRSSTGTGNTAHTSGQTAMTQLSSNNIMLQTPAALLKNNSPYCGGANSSASSLINGAASSTPAVALGGLPPFRSSSAVFGNQSHFFQLTSKFNNHHAAAIMNSSASSRHKLRPNTHFSQPATPEYTGVSTGVNSSFDSNMD